jgi:hypothetical protein
MIVVSNKALVNKIVDIASLCRFVGQIYRFLRE